MPARASSTGAASAGGSVPPGAQKARRRPQLRYELVGCALHGHELVNPERAARCGHGDLLYRHEPSESFDWYRCLRCDAWVPLTRANQPADDDTQVVLPLRGRPLRDRFVLRLIALDRIVHFVLLLVLAASIVVFARDHALLRDDYTRVLNRLQGAFGGPLTESSNSGLLHDLNRLFAIPTGRLYLYGAAVAAYAVINGIEAIGLWNGRRWAKYLTLLEVAILVPIEVYELSERVSPLKVLSLVLNVAVLAYLLWAHRLLGVRGGGRADQAEKDRDTGWEPLRRVTPWLTDSDHHA